MIGRNQKCPCGSDRKYKNCCLKKTHSPQDESQKPLQALNQSPDKMTYDDLSAISILENIPHFKHMDESRLRKMNAILSKNGLASIGHGLNENDGLTFIFSFSETNETRQPKRFAFDSYFSKVEIHVEELRPGENLKIKCFRNEKIQKNLDFRPNIDVAILLMWSALADKIIQRKQLDDLIDFVIETVVPARQEQHKRISTKQKWKDSLSKVSLTSILFEVESTFPENRIASSPLSMTETLNLKEAKPSENTSSSFLIKNAALNPNYSRRLNDLFSKEIGKVHLGWNIDQKSLIRFSESIVYVFSDGFSVHSRIVLNSPYCLLVPPDLRPGRRELNVETNFWSKTFSPPSEEARIDLESLPQKLPRLLIGPSQEYSYHPVRSELEDSLNEIVHSAIDRINRGELEVFLSFKSTRKGEGHSTTNTFKGLKVKRVEANANQLFQWKVAYQTRELIDLAGASIVQGTFTLNSTSDQKLVLMPWGFLNLQSRTIFLCEMRKFLGLWGSLEYNDRVVPTRFCYRIDINRSFDPQLEVSVMAEGERSCRKVLKTLRESSTNPFPVEPQGNSPIPSVVIQATSQGSFCITRKLKDSLEPSNSLSDEWPWMTGLSFPMQKFLLTLTDGFPSYFREDCKDIATETSKRPFEMKLLKHMGVFYFITTETLCARFRGKLSDSTLISKSSQILPALARKIISLLREDTELLTVAPATIGSEIQSGEVMLKSKITGSLWDRLCLYVSHIYGAGKKATSERSFIDGLDFETLAHPLGNINLQDLFEQELLILLSLLEFSAEASNGDLYLKARTNLFSLIFPFESSRYRETEMLIHRDMSPPTGPAAVQFNVPSGIKARPLGMFEVIKAFSALRISTFSADSASEYPLPLSLVNKFSLSIDGRHLELLSESDFKTEFLLSEEFLKTGDALPQTDSRSINWFELHPKFFLRGVPIEIDRAKELVLDGIIEHEGKYYLIPDNRKLSLKRLSYFWDRLKEGSGKSSRTSLSQKVFQLPRNEILEILALRASGLSIQGGARWREICDFYDGLGDTQNMLAMPKSLDSTLMNYQKVGVQRLYELYRMGMGTILADEMGLGKTIQTLAFLEILRQEKRMGGVLIVVPTSLTYNWLCEIQKFTPEIPTFPFAAKTKELCRQKLSDQAQTIVLTTYGLMQEHREFFEQIQWNVTVFDEAQNLKNISSRRTEVARSLKSHVKICLTGTPLENHLGELYSIADLAVSGCLGPLDRFRELYVNPDHIDAKDLAYLKLKIKPIVLRRLKKEILTELPNKSEKKVILPFEAQQKKIYRDIAISYNSQVQKVLAEKGEGKCQLEMLTALLRLRQACSDPSSLPGVKYPNVPPKLEMAVSALEEIVASGESALLFTQFLQTLHRAEALLGKARIPTFTIHGSLTAKEREKILSGFNTFQGGAIMLMTLKTGGVGLNLTKASYVFHLEPWWNPAVENQATDRAHRMGQTKDVQVYRYIMHESVEEKIEILKARKQARFDSVFLSAESETGASTLPEASRSRLSKEDFEYLIR